MLIIAERPPGAFFWAGLGAGRGVGLRMGLVAGLGTKRGPGFG